MTEKPDTPKHSEHWSDKLLISVNFRLVLAFILGMGFGAAIVKKSYEDLISNINDKTNVCPNRDGGTDAPPDSKEGLIINN